MGTNLPRVFSLPALQVQTPKEVYMSKFCGKCDLYDTLCIWGIIDGGKFTPEAPGILARWTFTVGGKPLEVSEPRDLVPYFPFIVSSGGFGRESSSHVRLTGESHTDTRAKEHFGLLKKTMVAARKKATRKGLNVREAVYSCIGNPGHGDRLDRILAERVLCGADGGKNARYDDLVPDFHGMYRGELSGAMVENGYTPEQAREWAYNGRRTW